MLYVTSKKIEYLPDSICMLKRLKSLEVNNGDLLEKLPDDLGRLECLEKLCVSSKKIEYLPDSICMLKRLKVLIVTKCCLGKLPEDIGQLECLEELYLLATMIKRLPAFLPEDLGRLGCLEYLDITDTCISHLPQSIFGLKGLEIAASSGLLQLYDFPSEIKTTTQSLL
ncbi:disease resistance TIR-NBS-LRR class family protein, partial [Tanacetum coccineum]